MRKAAWAAVTLLLVRNAAISCCIMQRMKLGRHAWGQHMENCLKTDAERDACLSKMGVGVHARQGILAISERHVPQGLDELARQPANLHLFSCGAGKRHVHSRLPHATQLADA